MKLVGKKPKYKHVAQSVIKIPAKTTVKQKQALARLKTRLGYKEEEDANLS